MRYKVNRLTRISNHKMQNKQELEEKLSSLLIFYSVIMPILIGMPFIPSMLKYVADVLWIGLIMLSVIKGRIKIKRNVLPLAVTIAFFLAYVTIAYLFRFQSIFYFLWGIRNLFRYYIAFFAYVSTTNEETVEKLFSLVEKIFWINTGLSIFQFVYMDVKQDYLGGVYGIGGGTNGYTIALLCVVVTRSLLLNFEEKGNLNRCFLTCLASLVVAAMAELKFFFVLFVFLLGYTAIITKFSIRKLITLMLGIAGALVGVRVLVYWFGFEDFFSIQGIIEQATRSGYAHSASGDVNRLSAIATLNKWIMNSPLDRIFGLGLGNCDTSTFSIFNSVFYTQYRSLHYTWFAGPMIYLETGYIGLAIYYSFFLICFGLALKKSKSGEGTSFNCRMAMIMSLVCCILAFYNASLRYEAAYMIYFILALPFVRQKPVIKKKSTDNTIK